MNYPALARSSAVRLVMDAYHRAAAEGVLPCAENLLCPVEIPRDASHGDYSCAFAIAAAKLLKAPPAAIAGEILRRIVLGGTCFDSVILAAPGFMNFTLAGRWYSDVLEAIGREGGDFAKSDVLRGQRIMIESLPVSPAEAVISVRGGVVADCLANIFSLCGADVKREFSIGNTGALLLRNSCGGCESIQIGQINLVCDGESAPAGETIKVADLPADAVRFLLNMRSPGSPVDFDLDLAVRSDRENPLYRVRYAHARMSGMIALLEKNGVSVPPTGDVDTALLNTAEERNLIKKLGTLPDEVLAAARERDPSRITRYLTEAAEGFYRFYSVCKIRGGSDDLARGRLALLSCARDVIAMGLGILNVSVVKCGPGVTKESK